MHHNSRRSVHFKARGVCGLHVIFDTATRMSWSVLTHLPSMQGAGEAAAGGESDMVAAGVLPAVHLGPHRVRDQVRHCARGHHRGSVLRGRPQCH